MVDTYPITLQNELLGDCALKHVALIDLKSESSIPEWNEEEDYEREN